MNLTRRTTLGALAATGATSALPATARSAPRPGPPAWIDATAARRPEVLKAPAGTLAVIWSAA